MAEYCPTNSCLRSPPLFGVVFSYWSRTHMYTISRYIQKERERDDINTNIPVTVPEVPDIASSGPFLPSQGGATTHVHGRNPISGTLSLENCAQDSICLICQCMQLLKYLHSLLSMPCYTADTRLYCLIVVFGC